MLTFEVIIVFLGLIGMVTALLLDKMRPGMILFSVTVFFLCFGILTGGCDFCSYCQTMGRVCLYSGNQIFDSYLIRYHIGWNVHAYRDFY